MVQIEITTHHSGGAQHAATHPETGQNGHHAPEAGPILYDTLEIAALASLIHNPDAGAEFIRERDQEKYEAYLFTHDDTRRIFNGCVYLVSQQDELSGGRIQEYLSGDEIPATCKKLAADIITSKAPKGKPAFVFRELLADRKPPEPDKKPKKAQNGGLVGFVSDPLDKKPEFFIEPQPLTWPLRPVPLFDRELLPEALRAWVFDAAERMSAPPEYIAVAAIISAASLVGRTIGIQPHRFDDWLVVCNLWGVCVGRPGVKKSPAMSEGMKPLRTLSAEAIAAYEASKAEREADILLAKVSADAARHKLASLAKGKNAKPNENELRELAAEAVAGDGTEPPKLKRFYASDTTTEALMKLLAENSRGLLIDRDEIIGWLRSFEKQGRESDRAFYLEAFNGTAEQIPVDRIGRESFIAPHCCLSLIGTIQPGPLGKYVRGAADGGESQDGLISRFQLLVYPDVTPYRRVERAPNREAYLRAMGVYRWLDSLTPEAVGAVIEQFQKIPSLRFSRDGQAIFNEWFDELETRLTTGNDSELMEQHLSKYRSLMPSLALVFHLIDIADGRDNPGPVSATAAARAAAWCELLEEHARRAYHCAHEGDTTGAELLAERLHELPAPFKARDIQRKGWGGLVTNEDVRRALDCLESKGWIACVEPEAAPTGRPPSPLYWPHPSKVKGEVAP